MTPIVRPGSLCPRQFRGALTQSLASMVVLLALVAIAGADCGDSIDGERVACHCGDVVVADTRLQPGDPIVTETCPADGLLVRAPAGARTVIVDLNGQEIHGSGVGTGVRILHGGADGAEIVGGIAAVPGIVSGFREGVRSTRPNDLRLLSNVVVRESRGTGVVVRGNRATLETVRTDGNGGDGVRTSGRSVDLVDVQSEANGRRGVRDHAHDGTQDVKSTANGSVDLNRGRAGR